MNVPIVITPPTAEPITLPEAKAHLRVIGADDDAQINMMITAARQSAEEYLQRALMPQTLEIVLDDFGAPVHLPWPPFAELMSVAYTDADGAPALVDIGDITADYRSGMCVLRAPWPRAATGSQVTIQYKAGYLDAASVPAPIKAWMLLLIGTLYENRESVVVGTGINAADLPGGIWDRLVQPYRVYL